MTVASIALLSLKNVEHTRELTGRAAGTFNVLSRAFLLRNEVDFSKLPRGLVTPGARDDT